MGKAKNLDYPKGLTFEKVWAALMESREQMDRNSKEAAERQAETERFLKEQAKEAADRRAETERQMKETGRQIKETDRQMKEYNKRFGDFTNRFGEIVEYMVVPNLLKRFAELNLVFPKANKGTQISDKENNIFLEIDVLLENGDMALLVETKTKPTTEDVKDHIKRLEKMRSYADLHGDKRKFMGAIAGVVMTDKTKDFSLKNGFFVVVPSGETFTIISPEGNAREW